MNTEMRRCQNCGGDFPLGAEDAGFYERIHIPQTTFCPRCRLQRRLAVRNERNLYRRNCGLCGKSMISMYSSEKPLAVYCHDCWWGDGWDPFQYGREYDFSKPFFIQYRELLEKVPRPSLIISTSVNSDYCNYVAGIKNCYLCFGSIAAEDCMYGAPYESKNCVDTYLARESEFCYECLDCEKLSRCLYCQDCSNSLNLAVCFDCKNCQDCIGCVGLRNKKHHIFNKEYSRESYEAERAKIFSHGRAAFQGVFQSFDKLKNQFPHRFATTLQCNDVTGDHIVQSKNAKDCFDVKRCEDSRYCIRMIDGKNTHDTNYCEFMELSYEHIGFWKDASVRFCNTCGESSFIQYSDFCVGAKDLFGCIGLRKKEYCILNKQYTKEEYEELIRKITAHMSENPYTDKMGRVYKYGEFFPIELSPLAYNETLAQEFFPLTREEIEKNGFRWRKVETKDYKPTVNSYSIPNLISEVGDDILEEVIECAHQGRCADQCTTAFKILPEELGFYRQMNVPLPQLCPNCRHFERLRKRPPFVLHKRACDCGGSSSKSGVYMNSGKHFHGDRPCPNEFETSYGPERKEIVYCEQCYNSEVI